MLSRHCPDFHLPQSQTIGRLTLVVLVGWSPRKALVRHKLKTGFICMLTPEHLARPRELTKRADTRLPIVRLKLSTFIFQKGSDFGFTFGLNLFYLDNPVFDPAFCNGNRRETWSASTDSEGTP